MFKKLQKMQEISHSFNSKTIIIKTMNLVVSLCHLCCPCCVMVCVHLVMFYGETNCICHNQFFVVPNNLNHNFKNSFIFGIFNWTWTNVRVWEQMAFMNHLWYMEIMDCLHFFNWNGLIARLPFSQGSIPCDLYPFNIRKFALKKGVNKNFILFNPSFCLACSITPSFISFFLPLSLFPSLCFAYLVTSPPFSLLLSFFMSPFFWCACPTTLSFFPSLCHACPTSLNYHSTLATTSHYSFVKMWKKMRIFWNIYEYLNLQHGNLKIENQSSCLCASCKQNTSHKLECWWWNYFLFLQ
jgi:hypothetical protein